MALETDPKRIAQRARKSEKENLRFRTFLKNCDLKPGKIDQVVHQLNEQVSQQIDCCACANCCIETTTEVTEKDIQRLAAATGKTKAELIKTHLDYCKEEKSYWLKGPPCPFLVNKKCSVYEARPRVCRSFPHLHKKDFTSRSLGVLENCSLCPIVFNVYEQMKNRLHRTYERWEEEYADPMEL